MPKNNRIFYGWIVAIAGAIALFASGTLQYSFGVFVKPLADQFGWSRAAISACISIRSIVVTLACPPVGIFSDRYGPRKFMLIGIISVALGYFLVTQVNSLWQLYLYLGGLTGIGLAAYYVPMASTVTRWFGGKSALANGIAMSGFSLAQMILPPLATYIVLQYGLDTCFIVLAIVSLVIGTSAWSFIRTPPTVSSRTALNTVIENDENKGENPTGDEDNYKLSEALHTRTFWLLIVIYMAIAICFQMVIVHIIAAAIDKGNAPNTAAIIVTLSGLTNTIGRLTLTTLARKAGNKVVYTIGLAIQALVLYLLVGASRLPVFYIIAAVYGLVYGGVTPLVPTLTGSFFGMKYLGSIFGVITTAYTAGSAIGPFVAGYIFDATGSYFMAFLFAAIAMTIAFLLSLILKPPQRKSLASRVAS
ncbi:MFS transporter [Chloroflexota bacterium]